jgi:phosphoglycolate phosphatase-like HAD superfamily hydrolase
LIDAVIFDFDGVILESADIKTRAFRRLFSEHPDAIAEAAVAYHLANEGVSRYEKFRYVYRALLDQPLTEAEEKALGERFSEIALEEICAAPFVPGAMEFLAGGGGGRPLFVASGTPEPELVHIAKVRGIDGYFAELRGTPATKAQIIEDILRRHRFSPERVAFVGDAVSDKLAAEGGGLRFIARVADDSGKDLDGERRIADLTVLGAVLDEM